MTLIDTRIARTRNSDDQHVQLEQAQLEAYESHRAMFEAYTRNKYNSTGLIQWMLNSPWPSNMWHLYDYYYQVNQRAAVQILSFISTRFVFLKKCVE